MRFYEDVEETIIVKKPRGSICNRCGEVFSPYNDTIQPIETMLKNSLTKYDICEKCEMAIIKEFKIVPSGFMISSFNIDNDLHQKAFDEWKETGEWNLEEENPYAEYMNPDISYDSEYDFNEEDKFIDEFYKNQNMDDSKPLCQATLKIVK